MICLEKCGTVAGLLLTIVLATQPPVFASPPMASNPVAPDSSRGILRSDSGNRDSTDFEMAASMNAAESRQAAADDTTDDWLRTEAVTALVGRSSSADETTTDEPATGAPGGLQTTTFPQVESINTAIEQGWQENNLSPSAKASDREFCRRLFLDLLGRIPSVDELNAYATDRRADRKQRLVNQLLYDDAYEIDYAAHWSVVWSNTLIGRTASRRRNDPVNRGGLEKFLRDSFAVNRPYDRMVHELITAVGSNRPGAPGFNGAVNFLAGKLQEDATLATAHTSKVFLGMQVQCTQCHNHPFNDWKQNQFWELNSFFRQTTLLRRFRTGTRDVDYFELANEDFAGEDRPTDPQQARIYYEQRNGKLEAAFPVFVDGTEIDRSGLIDAVNRRSELAKLVIASPNFPRAIVNRIWAHFLGYGFTRPIDDMGPHNPPQYPELLDQLANDFATNSFDLKQLISWIVLSRPYGLSSRMNVTNEADNPELGEPPRFSHFYCRQMTAEQLYRSLLTASDADKTQGSFSKQQDAQRRWLEQFTITFGTDEGDETTTFDGTITQTLMMFNGDLIKRATEGKAGSFLYQIANDPQQRPAMKLNQLFLAGVARRATAREQKAFQALYLYHDQDLLAALQDMWWALLNSNEFILNH